MKRNNLSEITVGIPFYHGTSKDEFLEAINSILNQSLPPEKIHLIQDGDISNDLKLLIDEYKMNDIINSNK